MLEIYFSCLKTVARVQLFLIIFGNEPARNVLPRCQVSHSFCSSNSQPLMFRSNGQYVTEHGPVPAKLYLYTMKFKFHMPLLYYKYVVLQKYSEFAIFKVIQCKIHFMAHRYLFQNDSNVITCDAVLPWRTPAKNVSSGPCHLTQKQFSKCEASHFLVPNVIFRKMCHTNTVNLDHSTLSVSP